MQVYLVVASLLCSPSRFSSPLKMSRGFCCLEWNDQWLCCSRESHQHLGGRGVYRQASELQLRQKKGEIFFTLQCDKYSQDGYIYSYIFCDFSLEYLMCFPCTIQFVYGYNNGHLPVSSPISGRLSKCSMNDSTFENVSWPHTIIRLWMSTLKCFTECVDLCGEIAMARIKVILCYHIV